MHPVSATWIANQEAIAADPSIAVGYVESREPTEGTPTLHRWLVDNTEANNAIKVTATHEFDYGRGAMPIEDCSATIENATYNHVEEPTYDFSDADVLALVTENPGSIQMALGYRYSDNSTEQVPWFNQMLTKVEVSDDDLYVTFSGESFTGVLDDETFYGGRYVGGGIAASTVFAEILTSARFPERGWWNYRLGEDACVASTTLALWETDGFTYYYIDPAFDAVMVDIPIPPVSHRDALTMLAAYVGAYLVHRSDGALYVLADHGGTV